MAKEYTPQQIQQLLGKLPDELKKAFSSGETGDSIWNTCEKNNINEVSKVTELVGNVLLGVLPPEDFQNILEKELKIEKDTAKKVAREINRFVFYPVKPTLEQLYKTGVVSAEEEIKRQTIEKTEEKQTRPAREDIYKEPIE